MGSQKTHKRKSKKGKVFLAGRKKTSEAWILNGKRIILSHEDLLDNLHEIFQQKNYRIE